MSYASDLVKVESAVNALLQEVIDSGKTVCFFDMNALMASLKLSHLPKSKYHDVVSDMLTATATHHKYGDWITCEYECSTRVLVQLAKAGETQSVCDEDKNHFVTYSKQECLRRSSVAEKPRKQTLHVEIPMELDPTLVLAEITKLFEDANPPVLVHVPKAV